MAAIFKCRRIAKQSVRVPVDDNKKLTLAEYRTRLYTDVLNNQLERNAD